MFLVEFLLPTFDNDGRRFPKDEFERVRRELTDKFGGVTAFMKIARLAEAFNLPVTSHGAHIAMNAVNGNVQRTAALAAALASGGRAAIRAWRARGEAPSASSSSYINHHRTEESHVSI